MNQQANGGAFNLLGTFNLNGSSTIALTDNANGYVIADAIQLTPLTTVPKMYFVHTDHLNTPRLITNNVGQAVWRYDNNDPFGGNVPDENPSGLGTFTCNLRSAGQYADKETGLLYNWHRTLDSGIGRYIQFDPIGLRGGINGYVHVENNPISLIDPNGLKVERCCRSAQILGGRVDHCWMKTDTITAGMNSNPQCTIAGNNYEPPYVTRVFVSDHSCDRPESCQVIDDVDETCVNRELNIGQSLGWFNLATNNCRSFANDIIAKCSTKNIPPYYGTPRPRSGRVR